MEPCLVVIHHFNSFHPLPVSSLFHPHKLLGGNTHNHTMKSQWNDSVKADDQWAMELDLRSREKEKRTLHWFVRGKQQKAFIKGVPARVIFGV